MQAMIVAEQEPHILRMRDIARQRVTELLDRFNIDATWLADDAAIDGSFWGAPEAGIVGTRVFVRPDTPVHSFLHETCHIICMTPGIRNRHAGNAESDDLEEAAVCYLQLGLAEALPGVGGDRMMQDMDDWGYSFRLGTTRNWFEADADDAKEWLLQYGLIDEAGCLTYRLREH
jgi:hypothetical protein